MALFQVIIGIGEQKPGFSLEGDVFYGIGDPSKLNTIISVFREFILEEGSDINTIMSNY